MSLVILLDHPWVNFPKPPCFLFCKQVTSTCCRLWRHWRAWKSCAWARMWVVSTTHVWTVFCPCFWAVFGTINAGVVRTTGPCLTTKWQQMNIKINIINHDIYFKNDITPKISNYLLHQFTKAAIDNAWSTLGISRATAPWRQRPWSWLGGPGSTTGRWPGRLHGVLALTVAHQIYSM